MVQDAAIRKFWQSYLNTLAADHPHRHLPMPEAWQFGDSPAMADELAQLVLSGVKTATCSRYLGENLAGAGGPSILLDGQGEPLCVVETTELTVRRYKDVDAHFAREEGEGDRSLTYWRRVHWDFFTREGAQEEYDVSEEMLLLCERLRVVYRTT